MADIYNGVLTIEQRQRVEALKEARSVIGGHTMIGRNMLPADNVGGLVYLAEYITGHPTDPLVWEGD